MKILRNSLIQYLKNKIPHGTFNRNMINEENILLIYLNKYNNIFIHTNSTKKFNFNYIQVNNIKLYYMK